MILEGLETVSPELAEQVRAQMFVFEDITTLDDRRHAAGAARTSRATTWRSPSRASGAQVREKVMRNLSEPCRREPPGGDRAARPAPRCPEVEEAQAKVVTEIRTLEQAGKIVIARGSDDAFVE